MLPPLQRALFQRPRLLLVLSLGPVALGLVAVGLVAGAAQARNADAPISLNADHIELQDKANRALFSGNVIVRQAEMTLNAARMTVSYAGQISAGAQPEARRIDASGGVTVTRPTQTARSNFAIYDLKKGVITMLGAVTLIQAGNTVNGGRLTIDLDSGRAVIDGSSLRGGTNAAGTTTGGGRVTGVFSVPKRAN